MHSRLRIEEEGVSIVLAKTHTWSPWPSFAQGKGERPVKRTMLVLCSVLALTVGVSTATAGGGNFGAAHACQQGGWQNLVRSDGSAFKNQGDCVLYAAQGGTLRAKATCTAGSENFSEDADGSQPTVFSGGTIDTAYGDLNNDPGGVRVQDSSWFGTFPSGTHLLFSGNGVNSFQLTFNQAVRSVQLDVQQDLDGAVTLTAYDAANQQVGVDSASSTPTPATLSVTSSSNNIVHFTIASSLPGGVNLDGVGFTNIVWGCN
jgi:hypothetical protein